MAKTAKEDFFNPAVTADVIVIRNTRDAKAQGGVRREVLLIRRGGEPDKGKWAFPGGHMDTRDDSIEDAAVRELKEETGIAAKFLRPVGVLSQQSRMDKPCICHVFCYSFWAHEVNVKPKAADDARDATWFEVETEFKPRPNELKVRLVGEDGTVIEFVAKFKFTRWGTAETDVEWKRGDDEVNGGGDGARMAFDHANMLARAFMQTPGFVNIAVGE